MSFQVIRPIDPYWDAAASHIPDLDLFFTSHYARTQECARLAVYKDGYQFMIKPFALRELQGGLRDIASLYSYGGAVGSPNLCVEFDAAFSQWCIDSRVVSEFCVHHPLQSNLVLPGQAQGVVAKRVVVLDTDLNDDAMMRAMRSDRRQNINRALRAGRVIVESLPLDRPIVDAFHKLYINAMDRLQAAERWRFSEYQVYELSRLPGAALFTAWIDGERESGSLILSHGSTAYYHLTANAMRHRNASANDLMVFRIMQWCRDNKIERLHLGGGVRGSEADPLFQYKVGFGGTLHDVRTSFRVFDRDAYRKLCVEAEARLGPRYFASHYEPAYRRDVA